jgi:hypothetical protein
MDAWASRGLDRAAAAASRARCGPPASPAAHVRGDKETREKERGRDEDSREREEREMHRGTGKKQENKKGEVRQTSAHDSASLVSHDSRDIGKVLGERMYE